MPINEQDYNVKVELFHGELLPINDIRKTVRNIMEISGVVYDKKIMKDPMRMMKQFLKKEEWSCFEHSMFAFGIEERSARKNLESKIILDLDSKDRVWQGVTWYREDGFYDTDTANYISFTGSLRDILDWAGSAGLRGNKVRVLNDLLAEIFAYNLDYPSSFESLLSKCGLKTPDYIPDRYKRATFYIECSLSVSQQFMRHRMFSFMQRSGRRFNQKVEPLVLCDIGSMEKEPINDSLSANRKLYQDLLAAGAPMEEARKLLPQGLRTKFYMTGRLIDFMGFFHKRLNLPSKAQKETQYIAMEMERLLKEHCQEGCNSYRESPYNVVKDDFDEMSINTRQQLSFLQELVQTES